ncbi:response regulator [Siphonobacter curvatus]|uniref:Sensory/regulatory protein RpfC n=1 Tax=Siphonobacter curvatus TaxID=2094562 RepID=A0A2S7IMF3_9BACT|nr:response regulator [Siphonobacter curvatus]PQA58923.1 histidine kinase [Siphonobacter curvatus]
MRLKFWILLMLGGGILIEILIGINGHRTIRRLVITNNWITHTHVILEKAEQIDTRLTHIDNDLRGHILSGNPYFLADFNRNARELIDQSKDLNDFAKTADQQRRIRELNRKLEHKLMLGRKLFIQAQIENGTTRLDSGRIYLDQTYEIRSLLVQIQEDEQTSLAHRVGESERSANEALLSIIIGTLVAVVIILGAVYLLIRLLQSRTSLNLELQANEKRLREILDAVPAAVAVYDEQGKVYYTNRVTRTLLKQYASFQSYDDLFKSLPVYQFPTGIPYPFEKRPYLKARRGQAAQIDDLELRIGDERTLLLSSAVPIFDLEQNLQYVVSSYVDITDRLLSHSRLNEAKEMAEKAALMKENFLANMSHEIRTPLNSIIGFTNLLETTPLTAEQNEYLKAVNTASRNLLTIVNDILDISKIEAGMLQFEKIPFSIISLVQSIKIMLQPAAYDKQLELDVQLDQKLPPVVLGDPTRLTQILLNLASNAIKFTEKGRIEITIRCKQIEDQQVWVALSVKDSGIGIAADVLPHIFERFRQESSFTTRQYGGSGLGLNIVNSLVDMQGGRIEVESTPGLGSLFTVEIPYEIAEPTSLEDFGSYHSTPYEGLRKISVLVVEDNPMNQKLATAVLGRMGYSAEIAENGVKALKKLREKSYDLILMDIQMPEMDGYETTRQIRNVLHIEVPIVAMTAHALVGEREHCLKVGMNDFISKPFQMSDLYKVVRKQLQVQTPAFVPATTEMNSPMNTMKINLDYLHEVTGGDHESMADLLAVFLEETPVQLKRMSEALQQQDIVEVGKIAHALKSPVQMIGAVEVVPAFIKLQELAAKNGDLFTVQSIVKDVIQRMETLLPMVEEARKEFLPTV